MRRGTVLLDFSLRAGGLVVGAFAVGAAAAGLAEFGIEGMGVVSTPANEARASVSPDGQRIVWASDRDGGAGNWDLWQATLDGNRWRDPQPLGVNSPDDELAPAFSADGRWLYFASDRAGGVGGHDLYRAAVHGDGSFGRVESLGAAVNSAGDERAPMPDRAGQHLLFASDGHGGAGGFDLFSARWSADAWIEPRPPAGINTAAGEVEASWLDGGKAIVFARSANADGQPIQLWVAQCAGSAYADAAPLKLSFNTTDARTSGPAIDWHAPGELLVSGVAKAPRAGKLDIYRLKAPPVTGTAGCV